MSAQDDTSFFQDAPDVVDIPLPQGPAANRSLRHPALYRPHLLRLLSAATLSTLLTPAAAALDFTRCCMRRARNSTLLLELNAYPWDSCGLQLANLTHPPDQPRPSVNATMQWCQDFCPGYQLNATSDWVQPMATWVAPAIAFLLLCPVEGDGAALWGYILILGDPGSALGGAFMDVAMDMYLLSKLPHETKTNEITRVILAGHLEFTNETPLEGVPEVQAKRRRAIQIIMAAKVGFNSGVFLPCVLAIAVAASAFYDAYNKSGNQQTAHNLAYGVWYNWLLVLSVVSNCSIKGLNPEVLNLAFEDLWFYRPAKDPVKCPDAVPMRERFVNTVKWTLWTEQLPVNVREFSGFYWKFIVGQTLGSACVAFFAACAATISFTTPTVGIGCRSLNFIIYAAVAFLNSWLVVLQHWAKQNNLLRPLLTGVYIILVVSNCLVLVLGTSFQVAGFWQSCRCMNVFGNANKLVELAPYTEVAIHNAERYWILVGHVSYSIAWVIICVIMGFRYYLNMRLEKLFNPKEKDSRLDQEEEEMIVNLLAKEGSTEEAMTKMIRVNEQ